MSNTETNPGNGTPHSKGVEQILQDVTQDLRSLQQDVVSSLSQDISRLQAERSRLQNEIEKLQSQQQTLQSQHQIFLTQQQIAQQKLWAKQLAQTMAGYLYNLLAQRLSQLPGEAAAPNLPPAAQSANSQQALSLLDATLSQTLASLQSDLNVYHSGLSQQIDRMQTLEQQGEALLEALVSRLNQQLQAVGTVSPSQPAAYSTLTSEPVAPPARPGLPEPSLFSPPAPSPSGSTATGGESAPNGYAGRGFEPPAPPNVSPEPVSLDNGSPPIAPTPRPTPTVTVSSSSFSVSTLAGIVLAGLLILAGVAMLGKLIAALLGGGTGLSVGTMPLLLLTLAAGLAYWVWQQGRAPRRLSGRAAGRFSKGSLHESPASGSPAGGLLSLAQPQVGLVLILLSTLALSLHNVVVGIIGGQTSIFGLFSLPRSITLDSFNDSLLVLWLRMVVVVPVMVAIARWLYPNAWRDIRSFALSRDRALQGYVVGSGACLFLSQVFIYIAIAATGPGVAVTILFMYPLILVPLAWLLFRDRPTPLRWVVLFGILSGVVLTALPRLMQATNVSTNGIFFAILSGIFFALYLITMQISFGKKLHPVPVSVVQFFTIFVLANIMLLMMGVEEPPDHLMGLLLGGLVLGTLTLLGYLLNNLGVRLLGAARVSIISASGPVLTALLAYLITPSERTQLQPVQWIGIVVVTLGVLGLSFERMRMQNKTTSAAK
ncbi:DMT family transporter [Thermoleptolyngbya sichuanensis XZ-Cy5]|uniref:DMT family transporter n=1 Tax=Thermoleptolyngbya sichuanensis TaxID=2885951 RepID=UPI00240D92E6|nr:DMT family transporter [Thermoleptolyngbya sichuanensis]MDG2617260.1 DMT family transporter [Thermoleptolyngbya sichuanensis XZ-Cy5]